jgi:cytochrome P450
MLLIADPLVADQIMRSPDFANRTSFPIIDAIYGQFVGARAATANMGGITFVNSEPWRRNRLAAQRCLSRPSFLEQTRRVTLACTNRLIESWRARRLVGFGRPVDLGREMSRLAIDVMGYLCWQTDLGAIEGDHDRFFAPIHTMLAAIQRYIYVPLPASVLTILPTPTLLQLRTAVRQLRAIGNSLMAPRFDTEGRLRLDDIGDDVATFLLRELVTDPSAPAQRDLDDVQATLMDLLGAGHDTTANALAFCLGLLSQPAHAHWQELAAQEAALDTGAAHAAGNVIAAAYRETLRLYPLGAVFSRVPSVDTTLSLDDGDEIPIAAGTEILVSPYVMGRDSLEWTHAARFYPERHLALQDTAKGTCPHSARRRLPAYAPYGGGKAHDLNQAHRLQRVIRTAAQHAVRLSAR